MFCVLLVPTIQTHTIEVYSLTENQKETMVIMGIRLSMGKILGVSVAAALAVLVLSQKGWAQG